MKHFECSQGINEGNNQSLHNNHNRSLSQNISSNPQQFSSLSNISQQNYGLNTSQNKMQFQQNLSKVDNTLKIEDLAEKSTAKNAQSFTQHQQFLQQQQSQQTLKSFNSSHIYYQTSTITTTANGGNPNSIEVAHLESKQNTSHMNYNHLSTSSQYNPGPDSAKLSQNTNQGEIMFQDALKLQNEGNIFPQNKLDQRTEDQKLTIQSEIIYKKQQRQETENGDDQVRFNSIQQFVDEENYNQKSINQKLSQDELEISGGSCLEEQNQLKSYALQSLKTQNYENEVDFNIFNSQENHYGQNQQYKNQTTQPMKGSLCGSVESGKIGFLNSEDKLQLKIVNEILNYDDTKLNGTLQSNLNATGQKQQQFLNTNHVDIGSRIGNSTIKNLFNSTKDFQDISNLMANIECTEENLKMFDELSKLNSQIKEIEETIQLINLKQNKIYSYPNHHINNNNMNPHAMGDYNILTVKDRLKSIDEFRNKNFEPSHLKEMINGRQLFLRQLNKELINLEGRREKQKQKEGEIIKQVDIDFFKDVELMNQGLKEINDLKEEVLKDLQSEGENCHNLQERKSLGKEELIAKLMQRAEMVAQMEDFEEIYEDFKQKFPVEAKYSIQQFQLKKEQHSLQLHLQDLSSHKKEQVSLSDQMQTKILELNEFITLKQNTLADMLSQRQQQYRIFFDKMEVIDEQINKKFQAFGFQNQDSVFLQLFDERHILIQKQSLDKQIELIEKQESILNEQYIEEIETLEQRGQLSQFYQLENSSIFSGKYSQQSPTPSSGSYYSRQCKLPVHGLSPNHLSQSSSNSESVNQQHQDDNFQQQNIVQEQQKMKETFLIRSTLLRKWKEKAGEYQAMLEQQIQVINSSENENSKFKTSIYDHKFLSKLISYYFETNNVEYETTDITFIADLYEQFFEIMQQQKDFEIQSNIDEKGQIEEIDEIEKKVCELQEAKEQILSDLKHFDEDILKFQNALKVKEQEISSKKIIMDQIILQQADKAFQDYIEQQGEVFEGLQKTYGNKALQQIKLGHHKQFREIMKQNQEKRIEKFEEILSCKEKINKSIQDNIQYVETKLSEDLTQVQTEIEESKQKSEQLNLDYQTILQKEYEFTRQLDSLIQAKKIKVSELLQESSLYMSYSTYLKNKEQLQKDVEDCEKEIKHIEQNIANQFKDSMNYLEDNLQQIKANHCNNFYGNIQTSCQESTNKSTENFEHQIKLDELKKQLDEYQMQRLALESRLIEINFNIHPSSHQEMEYQKKLLPTYITNLKLMNHEQIKQKNIKLEKEAQILNNNIELRKRQNDKFTQKQDQQNSSFFTENVEFLSRGGIPEGLNNVNAPSEINIAYQNSASGFFSPSKVGSQTNIDKNSEEINQQYFNQFVNQNKNNQLQNLEVELNIKQQQQPQSLQDQLKRNHQINQKIKIHSSINPKNQKQAASKCQKTTPQQIQNQEQLSSSSLSSSFYENYSQEQDNLSIPQKVFEHKSKQSQLGQQNQSQISNNSQGKNTLKKVKSFSSLMIMPENSEENENDQNLMNINQRNLLNQQQQMALLNQKKLQLNQENNELSFNQMKNLQKQKVFVQLNELTDDNNSEDSPIQYLLEDFQITDNNNLGQKNQLQQQQRQIKQNIYQQYCDDLGHTLQTITEEQMSTNRGLTARNNLQQFQNINQLSNLSNLQNDHIQFQTMSNANQSHHHEFNNSNFNQHNQENISNYPYLLSQKIKDQQNSSLSASQNQEKQSSNASIKNNTLFTEESMTQRERLNARKQQLIKQNQNPNYQTLQQQQNQLQQKTHHARCSSLTSNPQEYSLLLHENFKIKNEFGKTLPNLPQSQSNQIKLNNAMQQRNKGNICKDSQIPLSNKNIQIQQQKQQIQNFNNGFEIENTIISNQQQQENMCPNTNKLPQSRLKESIQNKNIQPLLNNTFHPNSLQSQQILSNDSQNWFFTPSSNLQISFNSYLNSSLNKSKQTNKRAKCQSGDNQKLNIVNYLQDYQPNQTLQSQDYNSTGFQGYLTQPVNHYQQDNQLYQQTDQQFYYPQNLQDLQNNLDNNNNYYFQNNYMNQDDQNNLNFVNNQQKPVTKKRRSKSEEMKSCSISQINNKNRVGLGLKTQLIQPNYNKSRSKSQSVQLNEQITQQPASQQQIVQAQMNSNNPKHFIYKLHLESLQNKEAQFLIQIKELLEGSLVLKKFSQYQSLKQHVFNPFTCDQMPPENCGFGQRYMTLHKNLTKIEIRHPLKQGTVESTFSIDQILRHAIPTTTADLIRQQKNTEPKISKESMRQANVGMKTTQYSQDNIDQIQYYAFCIVLDKGGRIEFIAQDYKTFVMWTQGIQQLIKLKKLLPRLKNHIEQIQII